VCSRKWEKTPSNIHGPATPVTPEVQGSLLKDKAHVSLLTTALSSSIFLIGEKLFLELGLVPRVSRSSNPSIYSE
jgi:hypothetical protein